MELKDRIFCPQVFVTNYREITNTYDLIESPYGISGGISRRHVYT